MTGGKAIGEFDLIAQYLAPLAGEGAFGLTDDAALLSDGLIVTKDLLVAGTHFFADDPLDSVAQKALRVNISDLAAKGCQPTVYFLGLVWPREADEAAVAAFAKGLALDQNAYGLTLLGGDTTRHAKDGMPLTISITMAGRPLEGAPVLRRGAQPGDTLLVTGTIGDGYLGLEARKAGSSDSAGAAFYLRPRPPFALVEAIAQHAHAALDVSDGLVADASHLAKASGVGVHLNGAAVPLSEAGETWVSERGEEGLKALLTGGDDYQCLMAVSPDAVPAIFEEAATQGVRLTAIGSCVAGPACVIVDGPEGDPLTFPLGGFQHF